MMAVYRQTFIYCFGSIVVAGLGDVDLVPVDPVNQPVLFIYPS